MVLCIKESLGVWLSAVLGGQLCSATVCCSLMFCIDLSGVKSSAQSEFSSVIHPVISQKKYLVGSLLLGTQFQLY